MALVASLGMYDGPGARDANDRLWSLIAAGLRERGVGDVPTMLDRGRPLDAIWRDPDLLLAQTCGYPLMVRHRDRLRTVAMPRYAVEGCDGTAYRSRIVVRADDPAATLADLRGARAAINDRLSNSGMNLFRAAVAPLAGGTRFFAGVVETGSHAASLRAVAEGGADTAAIDAVSFAHIVRDDPALAARVRTLGWTGASPGLPFVTAIETSEDVVEALRDTLAQAVYTAGWVGEALFIEGVESPPSYEPVLEIEREAARQGYAELA